jgi:hypothetical protein
MLITFSL